MKIPRPLLPLLFLTVIGQITAASFDVKTFGATGDGKTLDTAAINNAIDAAAAAGGGTVEFPAGNYLSYSIHLKSHIELHLGIGATIIAAEPSADLSTGYDPAEPNPGTDQYEDFGHAHWHNSLIWGENLVDIAITGPGRIFGRGLSRGLGRDTVLRDQLPEERASNTPAPRATKPFTPTAKPGPFNLPGTDTLADGIGNKAIALKNCRNVIFRD